MKNVVGLVEREKEREREGDGGRCTSQERGGAGGL